MYEKRSKSFLYSIVQLLMSYGPCLIFFMNNGASLLFVACLYEHDCILQALLINGADIKVLIFVFKNIKTYDMYLKQYDLYLRYI